MLAIMVVIILFFVSWSPLATTALSRTPTEHKGEALLESRCSACHPLSIVTNVKYDRAGWEFTVERMVTAGAQLNQD